MYEIVGVLCLCAAVHNIPIDDPSDWPGHLEPFGSKQNTVDIEDVLYDWPSPNGKGISISSIFILNVT